MLIQAQDEFHSLPEIHSFPLFDIESSKTCLGNATVTPPDFSDVKGNEMEAFVHWQCAANENPIYGLRNVEARVRGRCRWRCCSTTSSRRRRKWSWRRSRARPRCRPATPRPRRAPRREASGPCRDPRLDAHRMRSSRRRTPQQGQHPRAKTRDRTHTLVGWPRRRRVKPPSLKPYPRVKMRDQRTQAGVPEAGRSARDRAAAPRGGVRAPWRPACRDARSDARGGAAVARPSARLPTGASYLDLGASAKPRGFSGASRLWRPGDSADRGDKPPEPSHGAAAPAAGEHADPGEQEPAGAVPGQGGAPLVMPVLVCMIPSENALMLADRLPAPGRGVAACDVCALLCVMADCSKRGCHVMCARFSAQWPRVTPALTPVPPESAPMPAGCFPAPGRGGVLFRASTLLITTPAEML